MTKSFLIISAWSDENQHKDQVESIKSQVLCACTHEVISGLSALEAEREIYKISNEMKYNFDFILRLDGDMVLPNNTFLASIIKWFEENESSNPLRLTMPVNDFFSRDNIFGLHIWRASSTPEIVKIVSPKPESWIDNIPGITVLNWTEGLVFHAHNPSLIQSFRYGWHRAVKARSLGPSHIHWRSLYNLSISFCDELDSNRAAALYGAKVGLGLDDIEISWDENNYLSNEWVVISKVLTKKVPLIISNREFNSRLLVIKWHILVYKNIYRTVFSLIRFLARDFFKIINIFSK